MTCEEIILSAPKKQGLRVYVLDHCDKKALIEKYLRHEVNIENIEEVDFVGGNSGRIFSYGGKQRRPDCWDGEGKSGFGVCQLMEESKKAIREVGGGGKYFNVHELLFTPTSFRIENAGLFG